MDGNPQFDHVYDGHKYGLFVLETDGQTMKLKLKVKEVPGLGESGAIWIQQNENGKWFINAGLGGEEYDDKDVPNPIKKLVKTAGGGPIRNSAIMPPRHLVIRGDNTVKPYDEYKKAALGQRFLGPVEASGWQIIPKAIYHEVAKLYQAMPKTSGRSAK